MKRLLFVVGHFGSGSDLLVEILNKNPRIELILTPINYEHPSIIHSIFSLPHKSNNAAAIYMDELTHNYQLSHKGFYTFTHFIYVIRNPRSAFEEINFKQPLNRELFRYYLLRIRRIYEMARKTPIALFAPYEQIISGKIFPQIENWLGLRKPLQILCPRESEIKLNEFPSFISECEEIYERYYSKLKKLFQAKF
jgi:hypothetical protein